MSKLIDQEFFNKLELILDEMFPKGKCKERGRALILFAHANIIHKEILDKKLKEKK